MRAIILPPHDRWAPWTDPPDPDEPDLEKTYRILAAEGWSTTRLDVMRRPWNPLARAHGVLGAIDPVRALRVLLFHRNTDLVICFFESSALLILLLRRLLGFRGRVVIYDIGVAGGWRLRTEILRLVVPRADRLLPLGSAQASGLIALGAPPGRVQPVLTSTYPDFYAAATDRPDGYVLAVGDDASRDYETFLAACAGLGRRVIIRSRLVQADPAMPHVSIVSKQPEHAGVPGPDCRSALRGLAVAAFVARRRRDDAAGSDVQREGGDRQPDGGVVGLCLRRADLPCGAARRR